MSDIEVDDLANLSDDEFRKQFAQIVTLAQQERQENQLRHYKPVSPVAVKIWESEARVIGVGGGNRASKTDTMLAMLAACATGVFPETMKHTQDKLFRGPVRSRIICDSLTVTLFPVIMPKLQWWQWSGVDQPGGERGHWGWIPKYCLKDGLWEKSWSDKLRMLTVLCRDPNDLNRVLGESLFHFMSYDQEEGRGTDFHHILHDEPPPPQIWRESEARTMGVRGRMYLAMTWPDDPAIAVDLIYDEVYEPGMRKENGVEWFEMYTTDNKNADQTGIMAQAANWSTETKNVRLRGQPIRFSNRIHPLFTDQTSYWCFVCGRPTHVDENPEAHDYSDRFSCNECGSTGVCEYNHVKEFQPSDRWPAVMLLDPHPRKPHYLLWVQVDPSDDIWVLEEALVTGDCSDASRESAIVEKILGLNVALRLIDPNMGRSPSSSKRDRVWQDDFADAGLLTQCADDGEEGRKTLNTYLKPDQNRWQPRIHVHPRCKTTIFQVKRYVWADYKRQSDHDQRQVPRDKEDDMCSLLKYLMNANVTFNMLHGIGQVIRRRSSPLKSPRSRSSLSA